MIGALLYKYRWVNRVCVLDSAYSLMLYLLISSESEIRSTFFFWSNGIPEKIRKNFEKQSHYYQWPKRFPRLCHMIYYHLLYPLKWPFLLTNIEYWGHDHTPLDSIVIRNHKMHIIEDGLRNYLPQKTLREHNKYKFYYKFVYGHLVFQHNFCYQNDWCIDEFLTGIKEDSPAMHSPKVRKISIKSLWDNAGENKKNKILNLFGITQNDCDFLKKFSKILITQPLEDLRISEKDKVLFYREMIDKIGKENLVIKTHPRERTDYKKIGNLCVFDKKIPLELFGLLGICFKKAYTVNSTAIFDLPYNTEKIIWGQEETLEIIRGYHVIPQSF